MWLPSARPPAHLDDQLGTTSGPLVHDHAKLWHGRGIASTSSHPTPGRRGLAAGAGPHPATGTRYCPRRCCRGGRRGSRRTSCRAGRHCRADAETPDARELSMLDGSTRLIVVPTRGGLHHGRTGRRRLSQARVGPTGRASGSPHPVGGGPRASSAAAGAIRAEPQTGTAPATERRPGEPRSARRRAGRRLTRSVTVELAAVAGWLAVVLARAGARVGAVRVVQVPTELRECRTFSRWPFSFSAADMVLVTTRWVGGWPATRRARCTQGGSAGTPPPPGW